MAAMVFTLICQLNQKSVKMKKTQPATCNLQPATCNLQPATCNLQPATCNLQPATVQY
jgi:hypothetical protein